MDSQLQEKIQQKIHETLENVNEINDIVHSLSNLSGNNDFGYGIAIGRLYNSFYYQSRRILKRDPSKEEFAEFLKLLKKYELQLKEKFRT